MVATVRSATAGSCACIAATTAGGKMIGSLVVLTPSLFGGDNTRWTIHVVSTGIVAGGREDSGHDRHRSPLARRWPSVAELVPTPLLPADSLDLVDPLRSGAALRGRIEAVQHETRDAATVVI